jgi:hypothetical protein
MKRLFLVLLLASALAAGSSAAMSASAAGLSHGGAVTPISYAPHALVFKVRITPAIMCPPGSRVCQPHEPRIMCPPGSTCLHAKLHQKALR